MALTYSSPIREGWQAPDFKLPGVDERTYSLASFKDCRALVVIFMCNHCPYVIAVQDRIRALAEKFGPQGVAVVGINSNDATKYPDDSFEAMKIRAREKKYGFPYLWDETQEIARAYDAVCTPDPYVFENGGGKFLLRYHGRIDDNWKEPQKVTVQDLAQALQAILDGRSVEATQHPAMGCSIKWKN